MSQEQLLARPIPDKWSTWEVICHLADFEIVGAEPDQTGNRREQAERCSAATRKCSPLGWPSRAECRRGTSPDCIGPSTGRSHSANVEARRFSTSGHSFGGRASDAGRTGRTNDRPHPQSCSIIDGETEGLELIPSGERVGWTRQTATPSIGVRLSDVLHQIGGKIELQDGCINRSRSQ